MLNKIKSKINNFFNLKIKVKTFVLYTGLFFLIPYLVKIIGRKVDDPLQNKEFGIQDVVEKVRNELISLKSKELNDKKDSIFFVKSFDLEINFVIKAQLGQTGKVDYKFVAIEADKQINTEKVQKVVLHMDTIPPSRTGLVFVDKPINSSDRETVIINKPPN